MIKVKNLHKSFKKKIKGKKIFSEIIKDISFEVQKGEIVGFLGPNGAGKSTTIKLLTGIISQDSGEIEVAGLNPKTQRIELCHKIGCMFGQSLGLNNNLTIKENYELLGAIYDIPKEKLKKKINDLIEIFKINHLLEKTASQISFGQKIIAEIAAATLHDPEVLFLDEPTIGLDIVVKERVLEAILKLRKIYGTTVLLTSHDLNDVEKLCDRVIIIDHGQIIKDNTLSELKNEYFKEKTMNITYLDSIEDKNIDLPLIYRDKNKISIKTARDLEISDVISKLSIYGEIVDFESFPMPLEKVIYDIYTREA